MRARHKPPTLVSMWMLDVFCCALGCMILLFVLANVQAQLTAMQVQLRSAQAERSDARVKELSGEVQGLTADLSAARDLFDTTSKSLNAQVADLRGKLAAVTADRDHTAQALADAAADLVKTKDRLSTASADLVQAATLEKQLRDELAKKEAKAETLDVQLTKLKAEEQQLLKLLRTTEEQAEQMTSAKKTADDALNSLDAKYRLLQKESTDTAAALKAAGRVDEELVAARGVIKDLQKKYDDRNATIIDLENQNKGLRDKADKLKAESESRFAGVAMTGKSVVVIVDVSGSMKLVDAKTADKDKWPGVVATVGKVLRSLPDLERFQVVAFSNEAKFLFGTGEWQAYKGEESVKAVTDKLSATDPAGGTNIYQAFELAFSLRPAGLDTIYFFSDGLPSGGPTGLTPQDEAKLTDAGKTEAFSRHLRTTLKERWNAADNGKRVRTNAIGFFYESPEVGAFLWALARENNGSFVGMSKP